MTLQAKKFNIGRWVIAFSLGTASVSLAAEEPGGGAHGALLWRASFAEGDTGHPVHELRALPGFTWHTGTPSNITGQLVYDLGAALNLDNDEHQVSTHHELHRLWLEHAEGSWRLRAGRQELRFGPARLMRVLDWFEVLDPRDPASFAAGVDGLVFALNPADSAMSLTVWGILPSTPTPYVLPFDTKQGTIAPGGRVVYPLPGGGEGGLALHRRLLDRHKARDAFSIHYAPGGELWEQRVGIDGFWPSPALLWYEATLVAWQKDGLLPRGMDFVTLGTAYPQKEAWQVTAEMMAAHMSGSPLTAEQTNHYAAGALDLALAPWQRLSLRGIVGLDVTARLLNFDYWYHWERTQFGIGWYERALAVDLWGVSGTMLDPAGLRGGSGVQLTLRIDY